MKTAGKTTAKQKAPQPVKDMAQASLAECMGAVLASLRDVPDTVVKMPTCAVDAFLLVDASLSMLNRQLLDARRHAAALAAMMGPNDPMLDALEMQIGALEQAYAARLSALRRKREEGRSRAKPRDAKKEQPEHTVYKTEDVNRPDVREPEDATRIRNSVLWLWALAYLSGRTPLSVIINGPRFVAA